MSEYREPKEVAFEEIESLTEAIAAMVRASGIAPKDLADRLGIEVGHFNRMLNKHDSRHFPPDLIDAAMDECKSLLPLEWLAWKRGYALHEKSLRSIIEAIRDALVEDGKPVRFLVHGSGRMDVVPSAAEG